MVLQLAHPMVRKKGVRLLISPVERTLVWPVVHLTHKTWASINFKVTIHCGKDSGE
jgi:hypothetical protein